jgi:GNAT superfamily N-acetyltransferase
MVDIVTFDPDKHAAAWEEFVAASYRNPNYVLLSPTYLRWQFLDNPANATGTYTIWLALHESAIIALIGCVPFFGRTPAGGRFAGAYPINLMVRSDYRASGLGVILLRRLLKENPYVVNPGSNDAGAVLCMGLGMRDFGYLRRHIAILDVQAARSLAADSRLPSGIAQVPAQAAPAGIIAATQLPDGAPDLFSFPVAVHGIERSRDFLRWRYEHHPGFTYEFLLSEDMQNILVFHEERETQSGTRIIRIVDFLARGVAQEALLRAVLHIARSRGAILADFFCTLTCYDDALERAGFFDEAEHPDGRIAALFQPLDFRKSGIRVLVASPGKAAADWYISKGDSDQDRPNDKRTIGAA